jgi:hypothetical protein
MITCAISWHKYCINKLYVRANETHKLVISLFPTVTSVLMTGEVEHNESTDNLFVRYESATFNPAT